MPADLFVTPARDVAARSRQSSLVVVSLVAHAALFVALVVFSILLPDVLPTPRTALAWDGGPQLVRLVDIPLPPPPPAPHPAAAPPAAADAAPLDAPDGVTPEPDVPPDGLAPERGVQSGLVQGGLAGAGLAPPPPPPPAPAAAPSAPLRMHSGIEPPVKITNVMPVYPAIARSAGAHGVVIIEAVIDASGHVVSAKVLRSIPLLDAAAVEAVRQWTFTPARLNGEPVSVIMNVTLNFTLDARNW